MIEVIRIENQKNLFCYHATQNQKRAEQLELLITFTEPKNRYSEWHPLIANAFHYSPPHPGARFRSPFGRNVFYSSLNEETALYESAFHLMRQRVHLTIKTETGTRTLYFVDADNRDCVQTQDKILIDKNNYFPSQQFIQHNPQVNFILYPSCRDPQQRDNAAIFDIRRLAKYPKWRIEIKFFYDSQKKCLNWLDYLLQVDWKIVS